VESLAGFGSDIWNTLTDERMGEATVAVLFTDGEASDLKRDDTARLLSEGPPIVSVQVEETDAGQVILDEIASLSGGAIFPVTEPKKAAQLVGEFLRLEQEQFYLLSYQASDDGPRDRKVAIRTADDRLMTEAGYSVPSDQNKFEQPRLAGLYLTVQVGEDSFTHTLGGLPANPARGEKATAAHEAEVRDALFGSAALAVEGGAPTLAASFDDHLITKLKLRPLWEALQGNDEATVLKALENGLDSMPPDAVALNPQLPQVSDGRSLTFEKGLRFTVVSRQPRFASNEVVDSVDVLPFTRFATIGPEPEEALTLTIARTARLAVIESELFEESTAALLAGQDLVAIRRGRSVSSVLPDLDEAAVEKWDRLMEPWRWTHHRIIPKSGAPFSFWAIDSRTGTLIGVLPNGTGGGSRASQLEKTLKQIDTILSIMGIVGTLVGASQVGIVIAYGRALARMYLRSAIVISTLDSANADEKFKKIVFSLACEAMRASFPTGTSIATLNSWISVLELLSGVSLC
jgi:hypothetical protein